VSRATVLLVGTLDTKGAEYAFLRDRVIEAGCDVLIINAGPTADPEYPVDFSRHDVAVAAGVDLDEMAATDDRGAAVSAMAEGAEALAVRLFEEGRFHGILAAGGSGGSSIASAAMRALPVGVPKLLVSTMGAGDTRSFTGITDIAVMYSVVDIAGINQVSSLLLGNVAAGMAAMARAYAEHAVGEGGRPLVAATMWGITTDCVDVARDRLERAGYEVLVFHATGTGGRSMESLVRSGLIGGVLDVTTGEITSNLFGGALDAGPDRMEIAGSMGLPQVVAPGALDIIAFTPPESVPESWSDRLSYRHNPHVTLIRATVEESIRVGRVFAAKLNAAIGPISLFVPLRGFSSYSVEGGVFHDPEADGALLDALYSALDASVEVVEMDTDINDPAFAEAMAARFHDLYDRGTGGGDD
jgi:uncharacterized protein (UPF0261 family)